MYIDWFYFMLLLWCSGLALAAFANSYARR